MEKRPVAGISHSNDTKHRIVRFAGQPLPDVAFERPQPDLPGLVWLNRPSSGAADLLPDVTELEAYWTVARKDPALAPYALQKLEELAKSAPNDSVVLTCLGAVALSDKKDNAKAADYFSRALKLGSEDPTTYLNLATALENLGRHQEAESVLERGVAAYPYWAPLVARLAQQYLNDGQTWRASVVVHQYRKLFPEDPLVRDALQPSANPAGLQPTPARLPATAPPR
jgi:Tetratricopeptide repeat